jgi:molybdopterin synthase catalytic subunit/molybdopterin converting factor small subunit
MASGQSVRVRVRSFGPLKAVFGEDGSWRALEAGATVGSLLGQLRGESLLAESALCSAAVAVNQEYVGKAYVLAEGDEVAILPPVSGGTGVVVELVREPIVVGRVVDAIRNGADGAMVTFDGVVRDNTRGRQTLHLDYEAYEEMALKQMLSLRLEALEKFAVREVAIVHRLGRLVVGETSVLIVVASAHRGAAFEAARYVIDTLKKTVPIWKKEQFVDGAVWADGEPFPDEMVGAAR